MSRECCGDDEPVALSIGAAPERPDSSPATPQPAAAGVSPLWRDRTLAAPALSGVLLVLGYGLGWAGWPVAETWVFAASLAAGAWTFVPSALRRLASGRLGVGLLMTIAATGAVLLGHLGEAAALAFIFSIAEALEDRAMDRARHGLRALLDLIPDTARVARPGGDVVVTTVEVRRGDVLVVGTGSRVVTDGIVSVGRSSIDTSAITGESIPVEVGPGDPVPAGSINGSGTLRVTATADGNDSSLTTIVRLVEQAHARKGTRARLADRIARPLVPVVLALAALVALYGVVVGDTALWFDRALIVLVAASPCALAIAVPVTVVSAIGAASRFGVIIKSGEAFEQLGTVRVVALDKTGTLTRNQPEVVDVAAAGTLDTNAILRLAAAVEHSSTHPLAAAVRTAAPGAPTANAVVERPGLGVEGEVNGSTVRVGNARWLDAGVLTAQAARMADDGMSTVIVEVYSAPAAVIGIRDELRPEAPETVARLRADGVRTVMLTGDNDRTARALALAAGIDDVRADQLPEDKATAVEILSMRSATAMVGDGINDAPALAAATVGIAMGATGSAAAIESADVALTGSDLRQLPSAIEHARKGRRIMNENIGLALAIVITLLPLALVGVLGLVQVVLVHELAEVVVIANGIRAARRPTLPARVPSPAARDILLT